LLALLVALAAAPAQPALAQDSAPCFGELSSGDVQGEPAPPLRFGINPAGEAGALGPRVEPVPDDPARTLAALRALRPHGAPFVLRLNRFFWSFGSDGIDRFERLARRYTSRGYLVELQLRYHPTEAQEGDIPRWLGFVRRVVRRFGTNERVISLQVTNEVNFLPIAPDASDAGYEGAREALVRGVITAKRETRRRDFEQLEVGFNWAYRNLPFVEEDFWSELGALGGSRFVRSLDWVGLDAYPGTVFPPVEPLPGDFADGMVNALSTLRCLMAIPGIPESVPIHVEENGYPTGIGRPESEQVRAMEEMVGAVHEYRGTYNVTDYRWFDLRDHNSASVNFQHQYGLLRDDYTPKPAFDLYRALVADLS
jgi:hypothetical protein